ncbi:MAG: hypothetical protein NC311_06000 [Muribaculaceae bacterium]|nr:hypothetical protein [Muribaculaceae bacterium]
MKQAKIITLCAIITALTHVTDANAATISQCNSYETHTYSESTGFTCTHPGPGTTDADISNCQTIGYRCYDISSSIQGFIPSCIKCKTGYKQVTKTGSVGPCTAAKYTACEKDTGTSTGGGNTGSCDNGTCTANNNTWTSTGTGYQENPNYACFGSECKLMGTNYRCAAGYWGTASGTTSGCEPCPGINASSRGQSIAGENKEISSCYISKSLSFSFSDETGSGTAHFVTDCYYK